MFCDFLSIPVQQAAGIRYIIPFEKKDGGYGEAVYKPTSKILKSRIEGEDRIVYKLDKRTVRNSK